MPRKCFNVAWIDAVTTEWLMFCLVTGSGSWGRNRLDGRDADFRAGLSSVLPEPLPAPHNSTSEVLSRAPTAAPPAAGVALSKLVLIGLGLSVALSV